MRRIVFLLLCLIASGSVLAQPFDPIAKLKEAQERALAIRAARMDALRQIGEIIKMVRIDSKTTVKDFVTENDEINAQFDALLQGAWQEGNPNIYDDGTVEVKMVIYTNDALGGLQKISQNSGIVSPDQIAGIESKYAGKKFEATGTGVMRIMPSPTSSVDLWTYVNTQGKLMAKRAAQIDAYRSMGETVYGVKLDSKTTVKDFVTQSDTIVASFQGVVRGVQFDANPVYRPDGILELTASMDINTLIQFLSQMSSYAAKGVEPQALENIRTAFPGGVIKTTGVGSPPPNFIVASPKYPTVSTPSAFNRLPGSYIPKDNLGPQGTKPDDITKHPHPVKPVGPVVPVKPVPEPVKPVVPSAPDIDAPPAPPHMVIDPLAPPQLPPLPKVPERFVPEWAKRYITVTGNGVYPENMDEGQARAMARRAAQVDAYRLLAENALGVKLEGETTVKDFVAQNDIITARLKDTFIRGAETVEEKDFPEERYFTVGMKLYLGYMWEIIDAEYNKVLIQGYGKKIESSQPDQGKYQTQFQGYQKKLDEYMSKADAYQQQLENYYGKNSSKLSLDHPIAKDYLSRYDKYKLESRGYKDRYQSSQKELEKYQKEIQDYMARYTEYLEQYKKLHETYKSEAELALIPAPPALVDLSFSGPSSAGQISFPKPPERFVPEWAKKSITAKGIGAYPKDMAEGQAMAMARRAAQVDAYRVLVESAMGVHLSSETSVQDFLTQKDEMTARVKESFLRGAKEIGGNDVSEKRYYEVIMELYLGDMWEIIDAEYNKVLMEKYGKELAQFQPDQVRFKNEMEVYKDQLQTYKSKMEIYQKQLDDYYSQYGSKLASDHRVARKYQEMYQKDLKKLQEYQTQYPKYEKEVEKYQSEQDQQMNSYEEYRKRYEQQYNNYKSEAEVALIPPPPEPPTITFNGPQTAKSIIPKPPERFVPEWAKKDITATGTGSYPKDKPEAQAKLLAQRAAQVDAYRLLVESAIGVHLSSQTSVKDFITKKDKITARVNDCFLRGAQVVNVRHVPERQFCQVEMKLYLGDMWEIIDAEYNKVLMKQYGQKLEDFQPDQARYRTELELYQAQLRSYKERGDIYKKELQEYYSRYGSKLSLPYPVCKKYLEQYQKYLNQTQEYEGQYQQYQKNVEEYQQEKQRETAEYEQYKSQSKSQYDAYEKEADSKN